MGVTPQSWRQAALLATAAVLLLALPAVHAQHSHSRPAGTATDSSTQTEQSEDYFHRQVRVGVLCHTCLPKALCWSLAIGGTVFLNCCFVIVHMVHKPASPFVCAVSERVGGQRGCRGSRGLEGSQWGLEGNGAGHRARCGGDLGHLWARRQVAPRLFPGAFPRTHHGAHAALLLYVSGALHPFAVSDCASCMCLLCYWCTYSLTCVGGWVGGGVFARTCVCDVCVCVCVRVCVLASKRGAWYISTNTLSQ